MARPGLVTGHLLGTPKTFLQGAVSALGPLEKLGLSLVKRSICLCFSGILPIRPMDTLCRMAPRLLTAERLMHFRHQGVHECGIDPFLDL